MRFWSDWAKRTLVIALVALTLTVVWPATIATASAPAPSRSLPADTVRQLRVAMQQAMVSTSSPGALAGVWLPGHAPWIFAAGKSNLRTGAPMKANLRFRIASNTKSMTCILLLQLVDQGKVRLDDPVTKYVSGFTGLDGITLHQLCQNTSGLGDYTAVTGQKNTNDPTLIWPPRQLVTIGLAQPRTGTPGERFAYSNTGFVLLGMALQNAAREPVARLYQKGIFDRLGLRSTSFPTANTLSLPAPAASGYAAPVDASGQPVAGAGLRNASRLSNSMAWTAGGAVSDLSDLHRYVVALAKGSLVSRASAAAQWSTVPLSPTAPSWQGYGLGVLQFGPYRGHDGEIPGFISAMMSDPKTGAAIIVVFNNSTAGGSSAQIAAMRLAAIVTPNAVPWSAQQMEQALLGKQQQAPQS